MTPPAIFCTLGVQPSKAGLKSPTLEKCCTAQHLNYKAVSVFSLLTDINTILLHCLEYLYFNLCFYFLSLQHSYVRLFVTKTDNIKCEDRQKE